MVVNYFNTGYRYLDNVRFFKANDPYFYKVDNIPLKQLDENVKFLKDQTDGLIKQVSKKTTLGRDGITELQPYVDGFDSIVKVRPGRFSARINDAFSISPLQTLRQILGENATGYVADRYEFSTAGNEVIIEIMNKWHEKLSTNATNMNGLYERTFIYPLNTLDSPGAAVNTSDPNTFAQGEFSETSPYPGYTGTSILRNLINTNRALDNLIPSFAEKQMKNLARMEAEFIRRWRGVVRTAIVDVPNTLELEIPPFDASEFFYYDSAGVKQDIEASQRIDLLFIYSKPVDQSQTTVASYVNGSPRVLTEPALGIVKGAGIGVNQKTNTTNATREEKENLQSLDGVTLMLPNPSDELADNTGFSTSAGVIRGSFPSPDDLMNLAPLLSEKLSENSVPLIGQSILPVAYIVVKQVAGTNSVGTSMITSDDIIDIRPFMRTTELAYNERAGIAAAYPQISISNPVVSEVYIERVSTDLVNDYNTKISSINNRLDVPYSRIIGAGMVKGGMYYGVEGALASYIRSNGQATEYLAAKAAVESKYSYAPGSIPDLPDWDLATWCNNISESNKGLLPNDRIDYHQYGMMVDGASHVNTPLTFGPFATYPSVQNAGVPNLDPASNPRITRLGTDQLATAGWNANNIAIEENSIGANVQYYVSKTINIDRSLTPWVSDYFVSVQLSNCVPMTCRSNATRDGERSTSLASTAGIWVDKRANSFTIYVSWVANDPLAFGGGPNNQNGNWNLYSNSFIPANSRNEGSRFAGFSVINKDIQIAPYSNSRAIAPSTNAGVAIYPTVTFQIIGIPEAAVNAAANLNQQGPIITLR